MVRLIYFIISLALFAFTSAFAQNKNAVAPFDKVIVSPHIEVNLIQGTEEAVTIEKTSVDTDKINIKVKNNTLRVYLDDAKEVTKNETVYRNGHKRKSPIYKGTQVKVTITYTDLEKLSVRGEETVVVESSLNREKFRLKVYGEPTVEFNELNLDLIKTTIYGTGNVKLISGSVEQQRYRAYGEAKVDALEVFSNTTRITSYGAAEFQINTSEEIRITAYGETLVEYSGDPKIKKGLVIGEVVIRKIPENYKASDSSEENILNKNIQ
jgi:hypothetical protein